MLRPKAESAVRRYVGFTITQDTYTHYLPERNQAQGEVESLDVVNNRVAFEYSEATDKLWLPERPVRSISSLIEDIGAYGGQGAGDFSGASLTGGTDYYIDYTSATVSWNGLVRKIAGTWSSRARTIKVAYTAGLTAAELAGTTAVRGPRGGDVQDLKWACIIAAALAFKESGSVQGSNSGPVTSERLADYSVTYGKVVESLFGFGSSLPVKVRELLDPYRRYAL